MTKIVLELGINHFGNISEAKKYINFFFKSNFELLTFQVQSKEFYKKFEKKIDFKLPLGFYKETLNKAKKYKKKLGLAILDIDTAKELDSVNFDFYKLLSSAINKKEIIAYLNKKKKPIFISTGLSKLHEIKKSFNQFHDKKNITLLHTNFSYDPKDLNLSRINLLRKVFKTKVGYGHHFSNISPIIYSVFFNPDFVFAYIKKNKINKRKYPDDKHAICINDLKNLNEKLLIASQMYKSKKVNTKMKISFRNIRK